MEGTDGDLYQGGKGRGGGGVTTHGEVRWSGVAQDVRQEKGGVWRLTPAQNRRRAADEVGDHGRRGVRRVGIDGWLLLGYHGLGVLGLARNKEIFHFWISFQSEANLI
jgi:hypothetical protein